MKNLYLSIVFGILFVCSLAYIGVITIEHEDKMDSSIALGAAFTPVQGNQYYLSGSGITATQNTIQLTSFLTPDGRPLVMSMFGSIGYASIEPGTSKLEDVTFSGITQNTNGTAILTGVTRGNDFVSPYAASSTLAKAHAGGATFILSNTAGFYGGQFLFANNAATSSAVLVFGSTTPPKYDADPVWANFSTQVLADVSYVNSVVAGGAANASETVKGIIQLATGAQVALGTSLGSTGARLVVPASLATSTPYSATPAGSFPTSNAIGGKISQLWLDLTQTFSFTDLRSASTTLSGPLIANGARLTFPSSNAIGLLKNDGAGALSWGTPFRYVYATTTATSVTTASGGVPVYATSTLFSFPIGSITASSTINVFATGNCADLGSTSGSCAINVANQLGQSIGTLGVSVLGSGQSHGWGGQITLANNAAGTGTITSAGNSTESTPGVQSSISSTSINLSTATGLYLVLTITTSATGGVGILSAAQMILNP